MSEMRPENGRWVRPRKPRTYKPVSRGNWRTISPNWFIGLGFPVLSFERKDLCVGRTRRKDSRNSFEKKERHGAGQMILVVVEDPARR